jgi:putative ATP-dependent endonuclease of OLD family
LTLSGAPVTSNLLDFESVNEDYSGELMKIQHISIKNFRSIESLELDFDDYTALVGANGAGKSSVLYALKWFYDGGPLTPEDCHAPGSEDPGKTRGTIEVAVTFGQLTPRDRERLENYGRGPTAVFRRTWNTVETKDKVLGNALQGPGFPALRGLKKVGEFRPAYEALQKEVPGLPPLGAAFAKEDMLSAFDAWENDPSNLKDLKPVEAEDASHMFGIGGTHVINQCSRFVLVPAAADITSEVGGMKKGAALSELIGTVMSSAANVAKEAWLAKHEDVIDELKTAMSEGVSTSTKLQAQRVNARLKSLIPNASVAFRPEVPDWTPTATASIATSVSIDGLANDVARQGHGVQRAVLIAMLQALIPDKEFLRSQLDESEGDVDAQLTQLLEGLPTIVVGLEEPEIYQHPARARSFARVLLELATSGSAQVVLATHSPYFVLPRQYASLRRFTIHKGKTSVSCATLEAVVSRAAGKAENVTKHMDRYIPTSFSEGFFADAVVLVEGDTDRVVIESLAELLGTPLDSSGIAVVSCESKSALRTPHAIFTELGIPAYVVFDSDGLGYTRKPEKLHQHKRDTELMLSWLPETHQVLGEVPKKFGDATAVCAHWTWWEDDLESQLEQWPSFVAAVADAHGASVRDAGKNSSHYRTAVQNAKEEDVPATLRQLIKTLVAL